jgi:hypothetical protein
MANRAGIDPMTGVLDRVTFVRAASANLPAALLAINLDRFKLFNDQHGHTRAWPHPAVACSRARRPTPPGAQEKTCGRHVLP